MLASLRGPSLAQIAQQGATQFGADATLLAMRATLGGSGPTLLAGATLGAVRGENTAQSGPLRGGEGRVTTSAATSHGVFLQEGRVRVIGCP